MTAKRDQIVTIFLEFASVYVFQLFFTLSEKNSLRFWQFCWKISTTFSEFQSPPDWIELHPLIFCKLLAHSAAASRISISTRFSTRKWAVPTFWEGPLKKLIAHLCTPPHVLPPPPAKPQAQQGQHYEKLANRCIVSPRISAPCHLHCDRQRSLFFSTILLQVQY